MSARKCPWPRQSLPRPANPLIEDTAALELHDVLELDDEIGELGIALRRASSCATLNDTGTTVDGIVGKRGLGHQDLMIAIRQPRDDLRRGLLAREIEEELLDVLNLERALLEPILPDEVFHGHL